MSKRHKRIWLQVRDDEGNSIASKSGEVTWCEDRIYDTDVEYVVASEFAASLSREKVLREAVQDGINQIEYLHEKSHETGSGNAVLAKLRAALASTETEK